MDSNFDENKNLSNDVNFDSENIVRRDNKELFTRVEGAETRTKKAAEERARVERAKRRFVKRAENDTKRRARKIASAQRRAHLKAVLWEGKHKKRTLIIAGAILLALIAYPAYLGGSALIKTISASIEEAKIRKEEETLAAEPGNHSNVVYLELLEKYKNEDFEAGETYFSEELAKVKDDKTKVALYYMHALAITNTYQTEHLDVAIDSMLQADELDPTSDNAAKLYDLYIRNGDFVKGREYEQIYIEREGEENTEGIG